MKARMEKYDTSTGAKKRTSRNENLYNEVQSMTLEYVDIDIDNAVELSPSKSGRTSREDYQKQRELDKILPQNRIKERISSEVIEPKEDRVYDINEILKAAREDKLFEDSEKKRLINTEYNILTKLDVDSLENEEMKKEDLRNMIDDIYSKEKPKKLKKYSRGKEKELLSDLFSEGSDDETVKEEALKEEIKEELKEEIINTITEDIPNKEEIVSALKEEIKEEEKDEEVANTEITNDDIAKIYDSMTIDNKKIKKEKKKRRKKDEFADFDFTKEQKQVKSNEDTQSNTIVDYIGEEKEGKGLLIAIIIVSILILITCGFFVYEYFFGL